MKTERRNKNNASELAVSAMFTAVIAASAQLAIPLPSGVPVTVQTFTVALCGYCLGAKGAVLTVTAYILLGLAGVPVFSGFSVGAAALLGRTGGFIAGFIFLAFACGLAAAGKNGFIRAAVGFAGLAACHLTGVLWFSGLTAIGFGAAAVTVSLPYLVKDAVCVAGAAFLAERINKAIKYDRK